MPPLRGCVDRRQAKPSNRQAQPIAHQQPHHAAGFDVPYVQDQVGHADPTTTLAIYARVIRRANRDGLRAELRAVFGEDRSTDQTLARRPALDHNRIQLDRDQREGFEP